MLSLLEILGGILDVIAFIGELLSAWRFWLCMVPAICIAVLIHFVLPTHGVWISVPVLMAGFGCGVYWEYCDEDKG